MNSTFTDTSQSEAVNAPIREFAGAEDSKLEFYTRSVWHRDYQCDLHTWLSRGTLKTGKFKRSTCYFLFIEYRDRSGASRYLEERFDDLLCCLDFQRQTVPSLVLPGIHPGKTRQHPIGFMQH
ncbi:MAG: hypothetical protein ACR2PT_04405 [Endozoicomonas sp.]